MLINYTSYNTPPQRTVLITASGMSSYGPSFSQLGLNNYTYVPTVLSDSGAVAGVVSTWDSTGNLLSTSLGYSAPGSTTASIIAGRSGNVQATDILYREYP